MTPQEEALLASYAQRCPDVVVMQDHICAFMTLVRCHERSALDPWLERAEQTQLPELVGFAMGIRRDYAAVAAALESVWSQGVVEGQVNRIKMIKRQLYGRANLPTLKQHVLLSSA